MFIDIVSTIKASYTQEWTDLGRHAANKKEYLEQQLLKHPSYLC